MTQLFRSAAVAVALLVAVPVLAQSAGEKAEATGNDAKRAVKKGANRVDEALCTGTKAECAAKKGKHRVTETKDAVVDGTKKAVDKVD
jgi:hypothetical protein